MFFRTEPNQLRAQQRRLFQIETLRRVPARNPVERLAPLFRRVTGKIEKRQGYFDASPDEPDRTVPVFNEIGTKHFMSANQRIERFFQCGYIEPASEPVGVWHIEKITTTEELAKNKQLFLTGR